MSFWSVDLPKRGACWDVCGILSDTISRKTVNDSSTVMLSEIFSPLGGGARNTHSCRILSMMQGRMMFRM